MKVKNVTIRIKSLEDVLDEAKGVMQKLERGEKVKKHEGISFENLEAICAGRMNPKDMADFGILRHISKLKD